MTTTKLTPEQALTAAWEHLYGHKEGCPKYAPGVRVSLDDACDCPFEWDADTLEVVASIITENLPDGYLKHRADVAEVLIGAYGRHQVVRYHPGCICGWADRGQYPTYGEALSAALRLHLDDIKMNERA